MSKTNVWRNDPWSSCEDSCGDNYGDNNSFHEFCVIEVNNGLELNVKIASLVAAPSVVSIRVYSGEKFVCVGSGFIVECDPQFQATVITSATLFRANPTLNSLVDNLKVVVVLYNGIECHGQVKACDFHFNLAAISIQANRLLQAAKLRHVNDGLTICPTLEANPWKLQPHSNMSKLDPGYKLIALGRYHDDAMDIMAAPGEFSIEDCEFDCEQLFKSTSRITKCGIGGPMINRKGEVVGVNYFDVYFTPFLPINIVVRWMEHFKKFGDYHRPWLGMKLFNLFTVELFIWEKILQKFPNLKQGVIVDEVTPNSPAMSAGVKSRDIIIECDGVPVEGCLQFFDLIWDKVGKAVELVIARLDGSHENISLTFVGTNPTQINCWPLPKSNDTLRRR